MASIQRVAKGWRAQIRIKGERDDRTFPTKAAAQAWAVEREAEIRSVAGGRGSRTHTVGDVLTAIKEKSARPSAARAGKCFDWR